MLKKAIQKYTTWTVKFANGNRFMKTCQNITVSNGKIKKSASFKRPEHNIPPSLIELIIEDKQRLKHNLMMMHLWEHNLLWIFIEKKLCFYYWKKIQIKIGAFKWLFYCLLEYEISITLVSELITKQGLVQVHEQLWF